MPKIAKAKPKKPRELTADDYARVLHDLGASVEFSTEAGGEGAVILIKPGVNGNRPIVLTNVLFYSQPDDKLFMRELAKSIKSDSGWATYDIFG